MFSWLATGGMILSLLAPTNPVVEFPEPTTPPPGQIVIDLVTVNGSGCPAGTAAIAMSTDNTAFTVTYSEFIAQVGVGAEPTDWRRNCQLNLRVHVPQGFTYAVAQADYRGFAALADGASGVERANYYFQGMSPTAYSTHTFPGPMIDNWQATDVTDVASLVWHPCGEQRNFNINTELWALAGTSDTSTTTSFMTMDSTDGAISTIYNLAWKTCP
ncbi:DUF4360 domain-containing protein [Salinispora arenicola]|uniref:Secreted protein n=1 Tax=Salinispora arenicola (strain CNS-205) TaxID=391037 RepID=A8M1A7_SALAI|nr:DUF4360 domain-containing protein [Salinispora arenicola]MCN0176768.1 DUF4360 domain-containing protein [Salinispora arenicola]NIL58996.1 DUF4360 domain-containing protein [Salinispora arenicola]NIL64506.1 DUF4360 domain-containing protein [Salinispora arenicola]